MKEENLEALSSRLEMIQELLQAELLRDPHMVVVIAGDFNRHNPLWGGASISGKSRQE
jgi:endonuclease/exonuclease/phosphatase family metal-dependent hydrolase